MLRLNLSRIENCDMTLCNLDGANMFGAELKGSRFRTVDFSQTRIEGVTIENDRLQHGDDCATRSSRTETLKGINFTEADLERHATSAAPRSRAAT